ncbi:MAG TPA: class I SAM-dependent methyltransferase [Candidatus Eisenbacteria bacterium]|nr:class I SAM-dependent methyltransferase [Candidatus Eisenbacteria bacterium]
MAAWERRQCRGDIPLAPEVWETQYRQGLWRCLSGLDELARYGVIAGYLRALKPSGAILDIGCGEGLLAGSAAGYSRYVGIDVSEAALARARQRYRERCSFSQADARAYVPGDRFDAVIFNEVLYYFDDPLAVVSRYERWLRADGVIIASLYQHSRRAAAIAKRLKARYRSLATVEIRAGAKSWSVSVLAPESKPEA